MASVLAHGELEPVSAATLLGGFEFSWLSVGLVLAAALYLWGVLRLRGAGVRWPVGRTVLFLVPGLGSILFVTASGLAEYDGTLLSVHMIQHMVLSMIAPIFLALGAPVTLALRAVPAKPRHRLVAVLHSRAVKVLTFPLVAFVLYVSNPFILYFSGLYRASLSNAWIHEWVHLHFLITGCLFFWPLIGLDPLPNRWPYPARALLMVLSTPFHAVLGLTIMQSATLIAGDWYPALHLGWADPAADQKLAGGILWAGGELVSVTMLGVLVVQWMRSADREAVRVDRALDREEAARARAGEPVGEVPRWRTPGADATDGATGTIGTQLESGSPTP